MVYRKLNIKKGEIDINLKKLYELQEELDRYILSKHELGMTSEKLLDKTTLAMLVEVGELANTTRCFKHWSTKGMMDKEIVLDELADVWHFFLSIGNQLEIKYKPIELLKSIEPTSIGDLTYLFHELYENISKIQSLYNVPAYNYVGTLLSSIAIKLEFTTREVENAYLLKHEENYKRQKEGY